MRLSGWAKSAVSEACLGSMSSHSPTAKTKTNMQAYINTQEMETMHMIIKRSFVTKNIGLGSLDPRYKYPDLDPFFGK